MGVIDSDKLRNVTGISVDWNRVLTGAMIARSSLAYSHLRYETLTERDSNLVNFAVGFSRFLGGGWKSSLDVDLTYGQSRNQSNQSDLSRDVYNLRLAWNMNTGGRWQV